MPKARPRCTAIFQSLIIYITIALSLLWFVHFERGIVQVAFILGLLAADFVLVLLLHKFRLTRLVFILVCVALLCLAVLIGAFLVCRHTLGDYRNEAIEADYFKDKHVLFLAPHYDDDVSIANGIAELYAKNGSRVSVAFSINCDSTDTNYRIREAQAAWAAVGLPAENLYFLCLGNDWQEMDIDGETVCHIYHSPDDQAIWTCSYGNQEAPQTAYQPLPYTRENYVSTIQDFLLDLQPDVIYATDYDYHSEHRATSLFFEEALVQMLKQNTTYRPTVFKGYCYRTAWYSYYDFADSLNVISTVIPPQRDTEVDMPQYPWEGRVRLPLLSSGLNRILSKTSVYAQLLEYPSQGATSQTSPIANGDRVYWQRDINSLLYHADILVGDTPAPRLNDFKLMDAADIHTQIALSGIVPVDAPVTITLPSPIDTKLLALYDDPRAENQILEGYITLPDGTQIPFGPLNNNGSATYIPVSGSGISSLSLHITAWEGTPGLTEVEAYATDITAPAQKPDYFMIVDDQDNVVYDYYVTGDTQSFSLYTYPHNVVLDYDAFQIAMDGGDGCSASFENGVLQVTCPQGQRCDVTVTYGDISFPMTFSNPGPLYTWLLETVQTVDNAIIHSYAPGSINAHRLYYRAFAEKISMMLP